MNKKDIQRKRNMSYFIDATKKIIEEEGIELVTARKVADIAGYNSATIYNYFENLDHLIFFASMQYLKEYVLDLPTYLKQVTNPVEKYIKIWECFSVHSFRNPKIYNLIFFNKLSHNLNDIIKEYYAIFPEELGEQDQEIVPMLLEKNIYIRDMEALRSCVTQGYIQKEHIYNVNEMSLLMYQGMLQRMINNQTNYSEEEAVSRLVRYIKIVIKSYQNPETL